MPMPDSFRAIRTWQGSQNRAFEEICYQLLREPEDLPPDVRGVPIRTGNPDGGVEWYTNTADGKQWGWQAKYIYDIDALLGAMTKTVRRVVKERSQLTKLIFCIPWNLPAGTSGRERTSARQKYDAKVQFWRNKIEGAKDIEFLLRQESDLLARMALAKHAGRAWFWWQEHYLGPEWLEERRIEQADVAGKRYRPELQVDIPIQDDISALGFADSFLAELREHAHLAVERLSDVSVPADSLGDKVVSQAGAVKAAADRLASLLCAGVYQAEYAEPLAELDQAVAACVKTVEEAREEAYRLEAAGDKQPETGPTSIRDLMRSHTYHLSRAGNALAALREYLDSSAARAVRERFYFLTGSAGTGKTHLCLDSVQRALNEERPAVVLFGNQFGLNGLWASICDQLHLPPLGGDSLLGALEAAAEASSENGRRFVVMIDALNDTRTEDYWASRLPTLRAAFAARPLLSLLVTCRDTYMEHVDPDERFRQSVRSHPGFAGREYEATHKYFAHYELQEPRVPLLLPEFTVPLFLLTYCEGLQGEGLTVPPSGHEGRVEVFERFLDVQLKRVTRQLQLSPSRDKVQAALDALLAEMGNTGSEYVPLKRADELTLAQIPERTEWPKTALGALLSEGLLTQEWTYDGDQPTEAVRITYQAFSDFLILRHRLGDTEPGVQPDEAFAQWLSQASGGIREAAAILLPERYGVELPDLLEPVVRQQFVDRDQDRLIQSQLDNLDGLAITSLPYRQPRAITNRSFELIDRHANRGGIRRVIDVAFICSPQLDSPLNGDRLHDYLTAYSMPGRDAAFGMNLYYDFPDDSTAVSRLARWAAAGPYPGYDPRVIELASIPLVWMFSTPNRFTRDWITKALAQLLSGHLDVAARLVERFATVNDPYVLERLVTAAYGAVLRSDLTHRESATKLAAAVDQQIFGRLADLIPDALMLDAARGIIEWAAAHDILPASALDAARPPYGFKRPANPPTQERLDRIYPHGEGTTEQTGYGSIYISVTRWGDFGRYVIESGVRHFLRTPLNQSRPVPPAGKPPRLRPRQWAKFIQSLSAKQQQRLEEVLDTGDDGSRDPSYLTAMRAFHGTLTSKQSKLLSECWQKPPRRSIPSDMSYPAERAQRWVFHRTMTLGWTPAVFGTFDRNLHYGGSGREGHKGERFGKKYQWIAYHELLARIADNYHYRTWDNDPGGTFDGVYQFNDREIDPSLPPVPYREFEQRVVSQGTWLPLNVAFPQQLPGEIEFDAYEGDSIAFLDDQATLPTPERVGRLTDGTGGTWIVLYEHVLQTLKPAEDKARYEADQQLFTLGSWLTERDEAATKLATLITNRLRDGFSLDHILDSSGHTDCCYFGELGWRAMRCPYRQPDAEVLIEKTGVELSAYPTVEHYLWESVTWDCSIEDSARSVLPSTFLQRVADLRWDGNARAWRVNDQAVICNFEVATRFGHANLLVVREDWLSSFLDSRNLALVFGVRGERQHRTGRREEYKWLEFELSGTYDASRLVNGGSEARLRQSVNSR